MDYEKAYKAMVQRVKELYKDGNALTKQQMEIVCPELAESEEERIRKIIHKLMLGEREEMFTLQDETVTKDKVLAYLEKQKELTAQIVPGYPGHYFYDGNKLHLCSSPAMEEKQKEQKPVEPSDEELQRHQDELYDFKAFAAKQAKEHHISFVNDFEWNNFCDELLSFFYEKHTTDGKALLHVAEKSYQIGLRDGRMEQKPAECELEDAFKYYTNAGITVSCGDIVAKPNNRKPTEWSEEDEKMLDECVIALSNWRDAVSNYGHEVAPCQRLIDWLKSIRPQPHWKPSEEQMEALKEYVEEAKGTHNASMGGYTPYLNLQSLYNDLKKL